VETETRASDCFFKNTILGYPTATIEYDKDYHVYYQSKVWRQPVSGGLKQALVTEKWEFKTTS